MYLHAASETTVPVSQIIVSLFCTFPHFLLRIHVSEMIHGSVKVPTVPAMIASALVLVLTTIYSMRSLMYNVCCNLLVIYRYPRPIQAPNNWKADVKGRVYVVTGITNAIGIEVAKDLVRRGASVFLYHRSSEKELVQRLTTQLKEETGADLLKTIECDRKAVPRFTKWFLSREDTRLDGIVCCLNTFASKDGPSYYDMTYRRDFRSQCLLVFRLEACFVSQPSKRDVRIIFTTLTSESYHFSRLRELRSGDAHYWLPSSDKRFGLCQNLLASYGFLLQRQISELEQLEGKRRNIQVYVVDAGRVRGMLPSNYSLTDSLLLSPSAFLAYRSLVSGAEAVESIFYALYAPRGNEMFGWANLIRDCQVSDKIPKSYTDTSLQLKIYYAASTINEAEFIGDEPSLPYPSWDGKKLQRDFSEDEEDFIELGGDEWEQCNPLDKRLDSSASKKVSTEEELSLGPTQAKKTTNSTNKKSKKKSKGKKKRNSSR